MSTALAKCVPQLPVHQMDEAELACRMLEAGGLVVRPKGYTAQQALDLLKPFQRKLWLQSARAAIAYFHETVHAYPVNTHSR